MIGTLTALATAFNLVCSGTTSILNEGQFQPPGRFETTLRIDLSAMRWCEGACAETRAIVDVTAAEITLRPYPAYPPPIWFGTRINRESGKYESFFRSGRFSDSREGLCTRADFTEMPSPKF